MDRAPLAASAVGERRYLTMLFCDLVGSSEIAARLDPEEWREILSMYQLAAAETITHYGGHVAQYLGDGVMAYFGYPQAHDNDAERAAWAGLAILDAVAKLNEQPRYAKLAVRVGIDSGSVVVGVGAGKDADVFGEAPNVAARVQAIAEPGTVLITDAVYRLISGLFVVESRGAPALKGIGQPLQIYKLVQRSRVRGRLEAAAATRGLTPFVGREDEMRLLMNAWDRARDGEGQVVVISGEAGIGKSRLIRHFHDQITLTPHMWVEAAAVAFYQNTPFYPVVEILGELIAWRREAPPQERIGCLQHAVELAGLKPAEAISLLAPLLGLPLPAEYPPPMLTPEQQRRRLLATLAGWLLGTASRQLLVIATEDLQWADASTLELIHLLAEQAANARLLLLYTARPEFHAQWPPRAHLTQVTLNRLKAGDARTMIARVAAQEPLAENTIAAVVERSGGIPLFVEELTRAMLESDFGQISRREIPVTLHDSLMARLDRLGPTKEVLQVGAVIGDEFSYELLHAVHPIAEQDLQAALRSAMDAGLIYVRGAAAHATYQFKHSLIHDAAYEALLRTTRKELHRRIARTITEQLPALVAERPEVLARHWTDAGETEAAIAAWHKVGDMASMRRAFIEAEQGYQQALAMVATLPESSERDNKELQLINELTRVLFATKGYNAPETVAISTRAYELAEKKGNLAQLVIYVFMTWASALSSGDCLAAAAFADRLFELAQRERGRASFGFAYQALLTTQYYHGNFVAVEEDFGRGCPFFEEAAFARFPGASASTLSHASFNAWMMGRANTARVRMHAAIETARENNTPYDLAFSQYCASFLYVVLREPHLANASAAEALALCEKHGFQWFAAMSRVTLGWALAHLRRARKGITLIRKGLRDLLEIGAHLTLPLSLIFLAEAQRCMGLTREALATIEEALLANPEQVTFRPEILRLRAELQLKQEQAKVAEGGFYEAIALARSIGAKSYELRATASLARLLANQSRRGEARTMLADIYGWFIEGFDTADLVEAKALLEQLQA